MNEFKPSERVVGTTSRLLVLVATLVSACRIGWGDSITVDGVRYENVRIVESPSRYYFKTSDGRTLSALKSVIKPDDIAFEGGARGSTGQPDKAPLRQPLRAEVSPSLAARGKTMSRGGGRRAQVLLDMSHEFGFEPSNALCGGDGYLRPAGYLSLDVESGLREEILRPFDVLVLFHGGSPAQYTEHERALVKAFLEKGGGLLMYGDAGGWDKGEPFPLNSVSREVGVEFLPESAQGVVSGPGFADGERPVLAARKLRIVSGQDVSVFAQDGEGDPVIVSFQSGKGRVVAVSGSDFLTNPANRGPRKNEKLTLALMAYLASNLVGDPTIEVERWPKTWATRIDPDRSIEMPGFRVLYPDPLPPARLEFLQKYLPEIYSKVTEGFGYQVEETKTVIALMCAGAGWTASDRLVGIGVLGGDIAVASVMIHEISNSLCVETPIWLGDAGCSAYTQIKVKNALGGEFAESVRGEMERRIADYKRWEEKNGLYDLTRETDHHIGGGKVMYILSEFERKYGPDIMKRYFAVARQWKDRPEIRKYPIHDRVVFYFGLATGEDQSPFFKQLGTTVNRVSLER